MFDQENRPIVFLDFETTQDREGARPDAARDRIVQYAFLKIYPNWQSDKVTGLVNPGIAVTASSAAVHKITGDMVKGQPSFAAVAAGLYSFLDGANLAGYNLVAYDVPLLSEEFARAGVFWEPSARVIDAGTIFRLREPRRLGDAVRFYCQREPQNSHDAMGDVLETFAVLQAQLDRYPDLKAATCQQLEDASQYEEKRIDLFGKFVLNKDGVPCFNFGKNRGEPVCEDLGLVGWMLTKDFPANTLHHARELVRKIREEEE